MRPQQLLYQSLAKAAWSLSPESDPRFPPSEYYRYLKLLAAIKRPNLSVELGLCGGGGSYHLAIGWPAGTVVGVEKHHGEPSQQANWAFMKEKCPNFVLWHGDSIESAPEIARQYGDVDILFIDTVHTYEQTLAEFEAWRPFLSRKAVVCLDDLKRDGMQEAWDDMPGFKLRLDDLHQGRDEGGFGVVWGGW